MKLLIAESVAMAAIGDGVLGALFPVQHTSRWEFGPEPWRKCIRTWADHPQATRAVSVLEIVAGVIWAARVPSTPAKS